MKAQIAIVVLVIVALLLNLAPAFLKIHAALGHITGVLS